MFFSVHYYTSAYQMNENMGLSSDITPKGKSHENLKTNKLQLTTSTNADFIKCLQN